MTKLPSLAIRVENRERSLDFYTNILGFTLDTALPDGAILIDVDGDPLLLAGPQSGNITSYLSEKHMLLRPGDPIPFGAVDPDQLYSTLIAAGFRLQPVEQMPWGERILRVQDPDGYQLLFIKQPVLPWQKKLVLYMQGPIELERIVLNLSEQQLDLRPEPDAWSIRELVHHIIDGDSLWSTALKAALARSGMLYTHDWYTSDNACSQPLGYAYRPIDTAITLFQANRAYVRQMIEHLPGARERFILFRPYAHAEPQSMDVERMINMLAVHSLQHIHDIRQIRERYEL